mmetsp:Transcript_39774/g.97498  ORF Transcript_39774/g.97498 Transcript_39774/m.97498 type:complete len:215 (+) Transcript_39774:122-766(+)
MTTPGSAAAADPRKSFAYRFDRLYRVVWRPDLLPAPLLWLFTRALFVPSICFNVLVYALCTRHRWYDVIDDTVVLGALPWWWHVARLERMGVRGVVNMVAEFGGHCTQLGALERAHMRELYLPTPDYTQPSLRDLERAVAFIDEHRQRGERVYVHCKAGKGRAPSVVLCWLVARRGLSPLAAQQYIVERRPQISKNLYLRTNIIAFCERHAKGK